MVQGDKYVWNINYNMQQLSKVLQNKDTQQDGGILGGLSKGPT